MPDLFPGAIWRPSSIGHPTRRATLGITIHWTAGRESGGDLPTLDGPNVDCTFYCTKDGDVYQFLDPDSESWHGKRTANAYCIGIEHEGSGEPWTPAQLAASSRVSAWCCRRFSIPVRKVDPSGHNLSTFRGIFGHRDLSLGGVRVDENDHTDSVPTGTGWTRYLAAIRRVMDGDLPIPPDISRLPKDGSLRLQIGGRFFAGWEDAAGPMRWVARNGADDPDCAIAWDGSIWRGPRKVTGVCRHLVAEYLEGAWAA